MSEPKSGPSHETSEPTFEPTPEPTPADPANPGGPARSRSRWTVHAEWPVYENPWVDVLMADVELGDGTRFEHHVVRTRDAASCVVTRTDAGREEVLLIWRHRFAIDKWVWEIPSGLIEEGEDPAETARREVEEETGWRVREVTPLLAFHPVGGMLRTRYRLFRAVGAEYVGEPTEQHEAEKVAWVPLDEVLGLIDSGQIATGSSLVGLLRVLVERK